MLPSRDILTRESPTRQRPRLRKWSTSPAGLPMRNPATGLSVKSAATEPRNRTPRLPPSNRPPPSQPEEEAEVTATQGSEDPHGRITGQPVVLGDRYRPSLCANHGQRRLAPDSWRLRRGFAATTPPWTLVLTEPPDYLDFVVLAPGDSERLVELPIALGARRLVGTTLEIRPHRRLPPGRGQGRPRTRRGVHLESRLRRSLHQVELRQCFTRHHGNG